MSLQNFDPENVILLDGYELVKACYPTIDCYDYLTARNALDHILNLYTPAPVSPQKAFDNGGFWLRFDLIETDKDTEGSEDEEFGLPGTDYASLEKDLSLFPWCVNWLLPSGILLSEVKRTDCVSSFLYKGMEYAQFGDGSIVSLDFSLDTRFLELY